MALAYRLLISDFGEQKAKLIICSQETGNYRRAEVITRPNLEYHKLSSPPNVTKLLK
jgi:hypothetical protein